jgi:cobalamin biosynthesis Mg chelatase CobN
MNATPSVEHLLEVMKKKGYKVFDNDTKPYNINLVGIRTNDTKPNSFNDLEYVFWKYRGSWEGLKFEITTDPGLYYLKSPMNELGTAIVKPGQYPGMWQLGKHHDLYPALVQRGNCIVIRDFNRDEYLDYSSGKEETGLFGINNHRAVENGRSIMVDKWSAGCQVFADFFQFEIFMRIISEGAKNWTPSFTYTLLTENDL